MPNVRDAICANKQAQYDRECQVASAIHGRAIETVVGPSDIELFAMFSVDCGDGDLWELRKDTGGRDCVDKRAMTPAELNRAQDKERGERVAQLAKLFGTAGDSLVEVLGGDDECITDLLPKPLYV